MQIKKALKGLSLIVLFSFGFWLANCAAQHNKKPTIVLSDTQTITEYKTTLFHNFKETIVKLMKDKFQQSGITMTSVEYFNAFISQDEDEAIVQTIVRIEYDTDDNLHHIENVAAFEFNIAKQASWTIFNGRYLKTLNSNKTLKKLDAGSDAAQKK